MEPSRQRLPVRLPSRRTLHLPVRAVKTPQHLNIVGVPAKRNILGQCLENSPSYTFRRPPQSRIPCRTALPINNFRMRPLVVTNANQSMSKASPLVPLEEYEKHHEGPANGGIFKDFEKFRTLPATHTPKSLSIQSSMLQSSGKQIRLNRNYGFTNQKRSTKKENVSKNLIPIPRSPHLLYGVRQVRSNNVSTLFGMSSGQKEGDLASKCFILVNPSLGKNDSTYHNEELQPQPPETHTRLTPENATLTIDQTCAEDENKLFQPRDCMKHKLQDTNQSEASTSFEPMPPEDYIGVHNSTQRKCDLPGPSSLVNPNLDFELEQLSLLQQQHDLQNRQIDIQKKLSIIQNQQVDLQTELTDIQQRQSDCLKKMIKLQEENIKFLQIQSARSTTSSNGITTGITEGVFASTQSELLIKHASPAPKRRRSARLEMQAQCNKIEETHLIPTTSGLSEIHTKDNDTCINMLPLSINCSTRKRALRRKSVVDYYGGLRSSFKDLLQTPKETPCPGPNKSAKKVQFSVQDTPSRLTSTVMKQLHNLYDS